MERDPEPRGPRVTSLNAPWLEAYLGDNVVRNGTLLRLQGPTEGAHTYAVVTRQKGERTVEALPLPFPDWLAPGIDVVPLDQTGFVDRPRTGSLSVSDITIYPEKHSDRIPFKPGSLDFSQISGSLSAIRTGFEYLDVLSPVAGGGVTLILDNAYDLAGFQNICNAVVARADPDVLATLNAAEWQMQSSVPDACQQYNLRLDSADPMVPTQNQLFVGLRTLAPWVSHWRDDRRLDSVVVTDLPAITFSETDEGTKPAKSIGEIITRLGSYFASTHEATVTAILRLPLKASEHGLEAIADRLNLGDADAQIYIGDEGKYNPRRSLSNAPIDDSLRDKRQQCQRVLHRASRLQDTLDIMGEASLTAEQHEILDRAAEYAQPLT